MKQLVVIVTLALTLLAAVPLAAQPMEDPDEQRVFRNEVELQLFRFGNFFQAREGEPEEDVHALGAEYRAAFRRGPGAPDLYANVNLLHYTGDSSQTSYGARVGISKYGSVHSYNAYAQRQENGFSFDVGDQTATANITALGGNYSRRITRDWQVGAETYLEWQRFDVETGSENDYRNLGVLVRYRGFGRKFEPRVGFVAGRRDVETDASSYDDRYWYIQLTTVPTPKFNATVRYRDRSRDYESGTRNDDRDQFLLRATFRQSDRLAWTGSYSREQTTSSDPSRGSFDTDVLYAGLIVGF